VATLRMVEGQLAHSDQGNIFVDCALSDLIDPAMTAAALSAIPGLLGHGLFLTEIDALYIADSGKLIRHERGTGHALYTSPMSATVNAN
jgi:ribose 5-phosphate isomerase A